MQTEIVEIAENRLVLHPFRAAYWEEKKMLLMADLHLGKARHFRRSGIPVPQGVADATWDRLISLLVDFQPDRVLFLGDLFHSDYNRDWEELGALARQFAPVTFELVRGNHDLLTDQDYERANIHLHEDHHREGPFLFSHHPLALIPEHTYNLAGHLHPCVHLHGRARMRSRLPCFYFGAQQGILPAFGQFTGSKNIRPKEGDEVFVIADERVIRVISH